MIDHPSRAREDSYLISDSSMFSEIDCEIDSDFRLSWRFHFRIQFHFSDFTFALYYFSGSEIRIRAQSKIQFQF